MIKKIKRKKLSVFGLLVHILGRLLIISAARILSGF